MLEVSAALRGLAVDLAKIMEDLLLMSSGPRTGFAEIRLPAKQPGSSIMPGKVNPVMVENLSMICFQVIGNDTCVAWAASRGQLELNVMMPVIAHDTLESLTILTTGCRQFARECVDGDRGGRGAVRGPAGAVERHGHAAGALHRVRLAADIAKEAVRHGQDDPRAGRGKGDLHRGRARRDPLPARADRAGHRRRPSLLAADARGLRAADGPGARRAAEVRRGPEGPAGGGCFRSTGAGVRRSRWGAPSARPAWCVRHLPRRASDPAPAILPARNPVIREWGWRSARPRCPTGRAPAGSGGNRTSCGGLARRLRLRPVRRRAMTVVGWFRGAPKPASATGVRVWQGRRVG